MLNLCPECVRRSLRRKKLCSPRRLLQMTAVVWCILVCLQLTFGIHNIIKEVKMKIVTQLDVQAWSHQKFEACEGNFIGYGHQYAVLKDVVLKPNDNAFYISCNAKASINYWFDFGKAGTHLNSWLEHIKYETKEKSSSVDKFWGKGLVVAVTRYEYANLYHTMTDWYNVFILTKLLNVSLEDITIMLYDNHTRGHLDKTWDTLFGKVMYPWKLHRPMGFRQMAWNIVGYESPLSWHGLQSLPYVEDFHKFFLQKHGIDRAKSLDCDKIKVLFLWRHDYYAHPNNPTGLVSRKISNEDELISYFKKAYSNTEIQGIQIDKLSFKEQLEAISTTDILVSMHGAGLSHILFLPKHAGVLEMFTMSWNKYLFLTHFKSMARWRRLQYQAWQNLNPANELENGYTYVPPISLDQHFGHLYKNMCSTQ